jgi:hypothetical protein
MRGLVQAIEKHNCEEGKMGFCIWEWNVQHHLLKFIDPLLLLLLQPSLLRVGNAVVQTSIL